MVLDEEWEVGRRKYLVVVRRWMSGVGWQMEGVKVVMEANQVSWEMVAAVVEGSKGKLSSRKMTSLLVKILCVVKIIEFISFLTTGDNQEKRNDEPGERT